MNPAPSGVTAENTDDLEFAIFWVGVYSESIATITTATRQMRRLMREQPAAHRVDAQKNDLAALTTHLTLSRGRLAHWTVRCRALN